MIQACVLKFTSSKLAYPRYAHQSPRRDLSLIFISTLLDFFLRKYASSLDPFKIETGWFYYNFLDGSVFANPSMPDTIKVQVENTIELLKLNNDIFCEHRCACWDNHKNHPDKLYNEAPFIYFEAKRQHIL